MQSLGYTLWGADLRDETSRLNSSPEVEILILHGGSLVAFTIIGNCSTDRRMPINLTKMEPPPQADRWVAYFPRTKLRVLRGNFRRRSGGQHE